MKLIHKIFAAAASILALSSCVQDAIGPLTGEYAKPVTYELNTLVKNEVTVDKSTRTFNVVLTDNAATLDMKFVGNKYFLPDNGYTAATADAAKNGTYIVGNGGSTFTVNGNTVGVDSGTLNVKQTDGVYTFKGTLWLADESVIAVNSAVAIVYEADPEPAKPLNMADVVAPVADGVEKHNITLTEGEATVAILELLTAEGADIAGIYTCQEYASAAGLMGNGYSFPEWGVEGGSRYWVDGQMVLINAGETLEVTKDSKGVYKFVGSTGYEFTATAGNGGGSVDNTDYVELTKLQSAQSNVANGVKSLTISMATDGWEVTYDAQYNATYTGEGNYLSMDIYSEDGKLYTGTYNANTVGGVIAAGEFGIGYDTTMDFGWGPMEMKDWGTCWWTVENAAATAQKVLDGTVEVLVEGVNLVIKLKSTVVNAKFTYPIADFKDGQGNAIEVVNLGTPEADDTEYVELVKLQSAQSNVANGVKSLTISMATDGWEVTYDAQYNPTYTGEGNYLSMDIYSEDGKLYTGTYNANTVGGVIAAGEFGIGYDTTMDFGWGPMEMKDWGTCWWTVENAAATAQKVLDGTVEVLVEGANLVIKLKSTVVNAKFTLPVADFKDGQGNAIEVI